MKKILAVALVFSVVAGFAQAATVTNRLGQVMTVTKFSDTMAAGTAVGDNSVYATRVGEQGMQVVHYKITSGDTGSIDIASTALPKGSILLENAVIEVTTALAPATATNSLTVGGVTVLGAGIAMTNAIVHQAVPTPGITTSADKLSLNIIGDAATAGEFTVYLPYILGTAQ